MTPERHVDCLWVLANNVCNMACPDCYAHIARRPAEVHRLSWESLKAGIDMFMGPQVRCPYRKTITVFGGEPFMDFPLLELDFVSIHRREELYARTLSLSFYPSKSGFFV